MALDENVLTAAALGSTAVTDQSETELNTAVGSFNDPDFIDADTNVELTDNSDNSTSLENSANALNSGNTATLTDNSNNSDNSDNSDNSTDISDSFKSQLDNSTDISDSFKSQLDTSDNSDNSTNVTIGDVTVSIPVDSSTTTTVSDTDTIDLDNFGLEQFGAGLLQSVEAVAQNITGDGNAFNIDQVNNLVDSDVSNATLSFNGQAGDGGGFLPLIGDGGDGASFGLTATATGGTAYGSNVIASADEGAQSGLGTAEANASISQEAFTQNIVLGSNIQFNSVDVTVAGGNLWADDIS